jgi:hypothetical protein
MLAALTRLILLTLIALEVLFAGWSLCAKLVHFEAFGGQGMPPTDLAVFWVVGDLVRSGMGVSAYQAEVLREGLSSLLESGISGMYWLYPPPALALVPVLALVPYGVSYALFTAGSMGVFLASLSHIVPERWHMWLWLVFPAAAVNWSFGQAGLLIAALMIVAAVELDRRPKLSGLCIGLLLVKPHLGVIILGALFCGRRWHALGAALATASLMVLASVGLFGVEAWAAWFEMVQLGMSMGLAADLRVYDAVAVQASALTLGLAPGAVQAAQLLSTIGAIGVVAWVWWRDRSPICRWSAAALAPALASPYVHAHDLAVLALPIALVVQREVVRGGRAVEKLVLLSFTLLALYIFPMASGIQVTPLVLWAALAYVAATDDGGSEQWSDRAVVPANP